MGHGKLSGKISLPYIDIKKDLSLSSKFEDNSTISIPCVQKTNVIDILIDYPFS
jgi:hypothetical protein